MELWNHSLFTELIVRPVGEVIQIPYQGTCETVNRICIAPEGSNVNCYMMGIPEDRMRLMEMGYNFTCCNNSQQECLLTTTKQEMNNTLYTGLCCRGDCDISTATAWVGTTLKVIVLGK